MAEKIKSLYVDGNRLSLSSAFTNIAATVSQSMSATEILGVALSETAKIVGATMGLANLFDETTGELVCAHQQPKTGVILEGRRYKIDEIWPGCPARTEQPLLLDEIKERSNCPLLAENCAAACLMGSPLKSKARLLGTLCLVGDASVRFTLNDLEIFNALTSQANIAIENVQLLSTISQAKAEWEQTFDAITDLVYIYNQDRRLLRVNKALAQKLDTTPQALVGRKCVEVFPECKKLGEECIHAKALEERVPQTQEVNAPSLGGTFLFSISPLFGPEGEFRGMAHVAKDITLQKQMQAQLIQSEKLASIGEMISGVAHELNNPLTGVIGWTQLLLLADVSNAVKENLKKISSEAERCRNIVQNLLAFAHRHQPERTPTNVNDVLRSVLELKAHHLRMNNIEVIKELDETLPLITIDVHQLQQVILNLINNAEYVMAQTNNRGRLTVKSRLEQGKIKLIIEDDGPGIQPEILSQIFEPFFSTKEVGKGTGLGLSISRNIIAAHNGQIFAESQLGKGATFIIELPLTDQVQPAEPAIAIPSRRITGKNILVIDDEEVIAELMQEFLENQGNHVDTANSGGAALEKIQQYSYDTVICDLKLPDMNGIKLYERIKAISPEIAGHFIFTSGDIALLQKSAIGKPVLVKPFRFGELTEAIFAVISNH